MQDTVTPAEQSEQATAPKPNLRFEFSPTIGKLIEALAKASLEFKPVKKTSKNPFFKSSYADLAEVIDATREGLGHNGLAVVQPPLYNRISGTVEVITLLAHSSGEWMKSVLEVTMSKQDAQGEGSAITYGRRYAYSATLNVASEEDDDGNAAVSKPFSRQEEVEEAIDRADYLKVFEIQAIDSAIRATGKTEDEVKAYLSLIGTDRIEHIQRSGFKSTLSWANAKSTPKSVSAKKVAADLGLKPASQVDSPTQKAMKRLFAVAGEFHIPEKDVKQCAYEKFNVQSMTELSVIQIDEMVQWVKEVAAAVSESS
jgi:ERF superfamily